MGAMVETEERARPQLWREAYLEHAPALLRFLRRRLDSPADAEDLLQETFVRVMRAGGALREWGKVRAYLFATARHVLLNHRRRKGLTPQLVLVDEGDGVRAACFDTADEAVRGRELLERLVATLARLSADQRAAFELAVLEQLPYAEISQARGWTLAQVKINVYRARRRVLDELAELLPAGRSRHEPL
jgi:RNA polymerase sigma-70 factor (ECF subfamily)